MRRAGRDVARPPLGAMATAVKPAQPPQSWPSRTARSIARSSSSATRPRRSAPCGSRRRGPGSTSRARACPSPGCGTRRRARRSPAATRTSAGGSRSGRRSAARPAARRGRRGRDAGGELVVAVIDTRPVGAHGGARYAGTRPRMYWALAVALAFSRPRRARARAGAGRAGRQGGLGERRQAGLRHRAPRRASRVWFTLRDADMTEVHYPDLSHPSARDARLHGRRQAGDHAARSRNDTLPTRRRASTPHWRLIRTYVTDPERATVLIKVRFESLDGETTTSSSPTTRSSTTTAPTTSAGRAGTRCSRHDRHIASALVARPSLTRTSSGYKGHDRHLLEHTYDALRPGNVVQQAHTRLTGRPRKRDLTLALGFAPRRARRRWTAARDVARRRLRRVAAAYKAGLGRLPLAPVPDPGRGAPGRRRLRDARCSSSRPTRTRTTRARSSPPRACRGAGAS